MSEENVRSINQGVSPPAHPSIFVTTQVCVYDETWLQGIYVVIKLNDPLLGEHSCNRALCGSFPTLWGIL